jgi:hypothetical protein
MNGEDNLNDSSLPFFLYQSLKTNLFKSYLPSNYSKQSYLPGRSLQHFGAYKCVSPKTNPTLMDPIKVYHLECLLSDTDHIHILV